MKLGGLADVAGALPAALRALGHDVRVVMPRYRHLRDAEVPMEGPLAASFLPAGERAEEQRVYRTELGGTPVYLLDIPAAFDREPVYGEPDDPWRFMLFARGVLDLLQQWREVDGWSTDLVHAHDWHAAFTLNYLKTTHAYTFGHVATVFTIHNLAYQGRSDPSLLYDAGLTRGGLPEAAHGAPMAHQVNPMARGILFADRITTVSPTYAREILTPESGEQLDLLLRARQDDLVGILNGLDTRVFDPSTDVHLPSRYSADRPDGKHDCKTALQRRMGLDVNPARPLAGVVSRLVSQKGIDLLAETLPALLTHTDLQLVVLGSGDEAVQQALLSIASGYPERVAVRLGFDATLAQQIYAGTDLFLMPSRFEPCGLGQLIALRYGSVPVVRATGGLADTVGEGYDGNGFVFHHFDGTALRDAVQRALAVYRDPPSWSMLRTRGMREDHSWARAAAEYAAVYSDLYATRRSR